MNVSVVFRWIGLVLAVMLALIGLLFVFVGIGRVFEAGSDAADVGLSVFFVLFTAGVAFVAVSLWRGIRDRDRVQLQTAILRLALAEDGHLTLHDVCSSLAIDVGRAQAALDSFVAQRLAETSITEDGVMVYEFPKALDALEKRDAQRF